MKEVTDPNILSQLNQSSSQSSSMREVTDPNLLARLNNNQPNPIDPALRTTIPTSDELAKDPISGRVLSAVQGLASGGANIGKGAADLPAYILDKLGAISPETAKKWYKATSEAAAVFKPQPGQSDVFSKSYQNYPYTGGGAKLATDVAGLASGMGAASKAGQAVSQIPKLGGLLGMGTTAVGSGLINAAAADPEQKDLAFGIGAVASPVLDLGGKLVRGLGTRFSAEQQIDDVLGSLSTSKVNAAYTKVKSMLFSSDDALATKRVADKVVGLIKDTSIIKSPKQTRILNNIASQLGSAKSHADTLKILQSSGKQARLFKGVEASDELYAGFRGAREEISNIINQSAIKNGVQDALKHATDLSTQKGITDKVFKEMDFNLSDFSFKTASKKLGIQINKFKDIAGMKETTEVLTGLKKLTDSVANSFKPQPGTLLVTGAGLGSAVGYEKTGSPWGAAAGGLAGAFVGPALVFKMTHSPQGQAVLRALANPSLNLKDVGNIAKSILTKEASEIISPSNQVKP